MSNVQCRISNEEWKKTGFCLFTLINIDSSDVSITQDAIPKMQSCKLLSKRKLDKIPGFTPDIFIFGFLMDKF